jgi:hypothetical protein
VILWARALQAARLCRFLTDWHLASARTHLYVSSALVRHARLCLRPLLVLVAMRAHAARAAR